MVGGGEEVVRIVLKCLCAATRHCRLTVRNIALTVRIHLQTLRAIGGIYNHLQQNFFRAVWVSWQRVRFLGETHRVQYCAGAKKIDFFWNFKIVWIKWFLIVSNGVIEKIFLFSFGNATSTLTDWIAFPTNFSELPFRHPPQKYLSDKLLRNTFPTNSWEIPFRHSLTFITYILKRRY